MDLGLKDCVAVVTGGSAGIGLATATLLAAEGARVAICGRDPDRLLSAAEHLSMGNADSVLVERCDVLDASAVGEFAKKVQSWSNGRLDLLVNNAGQGRISTFSDTSDDQWRDELELKFFSQINPIRSFRPLLEASDRTAIVAVNALFSVEPEPQMVCTSAARGGVQNLMKSLATEFAPRIRVNSVLLGTIFTDQRRRRFEAQLNVGQTLEEWLSSQARNKNIPLGRFGNPDEVARAIAFLGSPAASHITGASLEISGGTSRHI
ncbi:short-chain dehydrogenase [Bradyrhizobium macuxiense]|uniref:Short-chain dehydrogenase n=1 Tax=Bradyrhizobium macuxiense TaxID=1755647 RepID=A0A120FRN4_9BRAD|nr:SDR family oxidoreductase [Bradyrhizobium macuxiense]KWV60427.1 short-chain dehydrogenase [Bradyrhizobium macuxiense]